jgi:cytochrome c biogenesis protein CcmG/thiol:disulfide interchange protein DsbE
MKRFVIPLVVFGALVVFLAIGLTRDPREVPSPFIGKSAPAFSLATLADPARVLTPADLRGKVWLLNVWASWCVACRQEHPLLVEFSRSNRVPIIGLDYKDKRDDAVAWLARFGNPYAASIVDADGRTGIEYGVYGVPETFLIDREGVIRYKRIGPLTAEALRDEVLPLIRRYDAPTS